MRLFFFVYMRQIIYIFFTLVAHQLSANTLNQSDITAFNLNVERLETAIARNENYDHSLQEKLELEKVQIALIQYFADSSIPVEDKVPAMELHDRLNDVLLAMGGSQLQTSLIKGQPSIENGTGIIRGFVRDASDDSPIDNIHLSLYDSNGVYVDSEYSDSIGRYMFSNLDEGDYFVSARHEYLNFVNEFYPNVLCPGGLGYGCLPEDLTPIYLIDGGHIQSINFTLEKNGRLTGILKNQSNQQPISGRVYLYNESNQVVSIVNSSYNTGIFTLNFPTEEPYYLKFETSGYRSELYDDIDCTLEPCDFSQATAISVSVNENVDIGDVFLNRNSVMSGTIADSNGVAISNSGEVEIVDNELGYVIQRVIPNNNGTWVSDPVSPGEYLIRSRASGYFAQYYDNQNCTSNSYSSCQDEAAAVVNHDGMIDLSGIDFMLKEGGTIKGNVYDVNNDSTDAVVYLYDDTGYGIKYEYVNSNGSFEFSGLEDGTYYISAKNNDHMITMHPSIICSNVESYSDRCYSATDGNEIVLTNSRTLTKNVRMKVGATVKGRVTDSNNLPLHSASIQLIGDNSSRVEYSDENGYFEVSNVIQGTYRLTAIKSGHAKVLWSNVVCTTSNCDTTDGNTFNVSGSQTYNNKNFKLPQLGVIHFEVLGRGNTAVNNGYVYAYNANHEVVGNRSVDSSGVASFALYPGNYRFIYKSDYSDRYIDKVYGWSNCYDSCSPNNGTQVNISLNQEKNVNMTLDKAFVLSGSINQAPGADNDRKYLQIYQNDELFSSQKIHSGSSFEKSIKLVGNIKVSVYQEGHYRNVYQNIHCVEAACGLNQAQSISVNPNQSKNINFDLQILNHIAGRVLNTEGAPMAGIQVNASLQNSYFEKTVVTDSNGDYKFMGLEPGNYNVVAFTDGEYESTLYGDITCASPCAFNDNAIIVMDAGDFLNQRNINMKKRGSFHLTGVSFATGGYAEDVKIEFINQDTNNSRSFQTDSAGDLEEVLLSEGRYKLIASVGNYYSQKIYTAYPQISCGNNIEVCLDSSPVFEVNSQNSHAVSDFVVDQKGKLSVQLFDDESLTAISGVSVQILDSQLNVINSVGSQQGLAEINNVSDGDYYVYVSTDSNDSHLSELYDDIECGPGMGIGCQLTQGQTLRFERNSVQNINIGLKKKPSLKVNVVDAFTNESIEGSVKIFTESGHSIYSYNYDSQYEIPMNSGQYYIVGQSNGYNIKAFPGAQCSGGWDLDYCDILNAQLVSIQGEDVEVSLGLDLVDGVVGRVINEATGEPIAGAVVDFWRESSSYIDSSILTNELGRFSMKLRTYYDFKVSTDIDLNLGLYNEVYNNRICFDGAAVLGLCDMNQAELIDLDEPDTHYIEFKLNGDPIFDAGFEME